LVRVPFCCVVVSSAMSGHKCEGFSERRKNLQYLGIGCGAPALICVVGSLLAIRSLTVVNWGLLSWKGMSKSKILKQRNIQSFENRHNGPSPTFILVILALHCPVVICRVVKGGGCGWSMLCRKKMFNFTFQVQQTRESYHVTYSHNSKNLFKFPYYLAHPANYHHDAEEVQRCVPIL